MAQVRNMNFYKGKLGDIQFRRQTVKAETGGYKTATIAYQKGTYTDRKTPKQLRQRAKFAVVALLASFLRTHLAHYFNPTGLADVGIRAFNSYNIKKAAVVSGNGAYINFKKLLVSRGNLNVCNTHVWQPLEPAPENCACWKLITWDYDYLVDGWGGDIYMMITAVSVKADGTIDCIKQIPTPVTLNHCAAHVALPTCDCCTTFYYVTWVQNETVLNSDSIYIGTCACEDPAISEDACLVCNLPPEVEEPEVGDWCPEHCGDAGDPVVYEPGQNLWNFPGATDRNYGSGRRLWNFPGGDDNEDKGRNLWNLGSANDSDKPHGKPATNMARRIANGNLPVLPDDEESDDGDGNGNGNGNGPKDKPVDAPGGELVKGGEPEKPKV